MSPVSPYLPAFRRLLTEQKGVQLLNVYKGVPIAYEASLIQVRDASIQVKTSPYQMVCLYHERKTYIQSPALPYILKAAVLNMELPLLRAELGEFQGAAAGVGERRHVRVKPEGVVMGAVYTPGIGMPFQAELADISALGLALYVPYSNFYPTVYRKGVRLTVTLRLPGEYEMVEPQKGEEAAETHDPLYRFSREALRLSRTPGSGYLGGKTTGALVRRLIPFPEMDIHGEIVNLSEEAEFRRYRLGIRILAGDPSQSVIQCFISQRQAEIVREIQTVYAMITNKTSDA